MNGLAIDRSRLALLTVAAAGCVLTPLLMLAGAHSPLRVLAALALFGAGPGAAALPLLAPRGRDVEPGAVLGVSLAVSVLVAQAMLWLGGWWPQAATCALAAACLVSIAVQLRRLARVGETA